MDNQDNLDINDDEYNSEEEEAEYLREILKNKKVEEDLDNIDDILMKNKKDNKKIKDNKDSKDNKDIKNNNKNKAFSKSLNSEIFKKDINESRHKYYFKPRLPSIYKNET
jgi:hypothetical protein